MSVKEFFKGKAFKCIAVLMSILLVSGVLLAICWGFLEVTEEERFARKINSFYNGDSVTAVEVSDLADKNTKVGSATIQKMWYITEKNDYLVQVSARGYGGDIICWVGVTLDENKKDVTGISRVMLYGKGDAAELTGNIPSSVYEKFVQDYTDGKHFEYGYTSSGSKGEQYIETGASYSMTAICNDVNGAITFVKAYISGEDIVDPNAGFEYADFINMDATAWTNNNGEIAYDIVTTANGMPQSFTISIKVNKINNTAEITAFEIITNGSTGDKWSNQMSEALKDMVGKTLADIEEILADERSKEDNGTLHTGATRSNELCFNAAAFALANYDECIKADKKPFDPYEEYTYKELVDMEATAWTNNSGEITYNIITTANGKPQPFTISIKVNKINNTAQITAFEIITDGSTGDKWSNQMSDALKNMVGKTLAEIEEILADERSKEDDGTLHTGATRSNELCFNAAAFALANYDICLVADKEVTENE